VPPECGSRSIVAGEVAFVYGRVSRTTGAERHVIDEHALDALEFTHGFDLRPLR